MHDARFRLLLLTTTLFCACGDDGSSPVDASMPADAGPDDSSVAGDDSGVPGADLSEADLLPEPDLLPPSCTASTSACNGDTLVVCDGSGHVKSSTSCSLGCTTGRLPGTASCVPLTPLYAVPAPSGALPALDVTTSSTLDLSHCNDAAPATPYVMVTVGNTSTGYMAPVVGNINNPIGTCILAFQSVTLHSGVTLTVTSSVNNVLSLGSETTTDIEGTIVFRTSQNSYCAGHSTTSGLPDSNGIHYAAGAGGGANRYPGGPGGACTTTGLCPSNGSGGAGGSPALAVVNQLVPGGPGGDVFDGANPATKIGFGGGGGGGLHLLALDHVTIGGSAQIDLNGLGGRGLKQGAFADYPAGGGGAGGQLSVEAPRVTVASGAIIAANGGSGAGGCVTRVGPVFFHVDGTDGKMSTSQAPAASCPVVSGCALGAGNGGGSTATLASNGSDDCPSNGGFPTGGGGGGSIGQILFRARDTTPAYLSISPNAVISPAPSAGRVNH